MSDWKTYKSQPPFQFIEAFSFRYNEGDRISKHTNPLWPIQDIIEGVVTPTHLPCKYWGRVPAGFYSYVEPPLCTCEGETIGYTSAQMSINQTQSLTVVGAREGCVYTWGLAGGGSLSSNTGTTIVYTAPATNPNCANNAVITLQLEGEICDTLEIAVNAYASDLRVYEINSDCIEYCVQAVPNPWYNAKYYYTKVGYKCNGTVYDTRNVTIKSLSGGSWRSCPAILDALNYSWIYSCAHIYGVSCCAAYEAGLIYGDLPGVTDLRTTAQKTAGCCPAALL